MRVDGSRFRATFSLVAAWPIAALLAAMSLGGLLTDAYAREAPAWVDQAIGQDWFDLLVAAPFIALCGVMARRSYRWRVLLAGAYAFTVYTLVIYAFAVHFNALFLLYCATLGLSSYALIALLGNLRDHVKPVDRRGARVGGAFLVGLGAVFTLMWLAEDLPAVLANRPSEALAETGLFTNPVHAIDLSFVLPAHVITGVLLWRRHRAGERYAPVVLAFGILMSASIGGMLVAIALAGGEAPVPVIAAMFAVSIATTLVFARVSRARPARADHGQPFSARAPARA